MHPLRGRPSPSARIEASEKLQMFVHPLAPAEVLVGFRYELEASESFLIIRMQDFESELCTAGVFSARVAGYSRCSLSLYAHL